MKRLISLIEKFQKLSEITGATKTSSYGVTISFSPNDNLVHFELGGYDIPGWSRHTYFSSSKEKMLEELESWVDKAISDVDSEY